jgi:hypothetical protein
MKTYASQQNLLLILVLVAFTVPGIAVAQSAQSTFFTEVTGLFNIFVGLMLTAALLTYGVGTLMWFTRLGTWPSYRTEAIKILEWAVAILFTLVLLLIVVQFFRDHPYAASYLVAFIVLILVIWAIITFAKSGEEKDEKPARR